MIDPNFWNERRVFLTGHTGFKGSWLSLWLNQLGARVSAFSLPPPTSPSHFELAAINDLVDTTFGDIVDLAALESAMQKAQPEIVIHLAAESVIRRSYREPVRTFTTNLLGTVHLLEAVRHTPSVRTVVVITSDKCYHNREWVWGYREDSDLGGDDPYSASKACAELATAAYQHAYFGRQNGPESASVATTRAGNVIGGADWTDHALVPDILRSLLKNEPTLIRNPIATRPWQHVLDPLNGYLMLAERLTTDRHDFAEAWNFGPGEKSEKNVGWIIDQLYRLWGTEMEWLRDANPGPPENTYLKLDSSKARSRLGWRPRLDLPTTLDWIVDWTKRYQAGEDVREVSLQTIERYMDLAPED